MNYDYLIVGAGLYGCAFARAATDRGKRCLIVERKAHIGGSCYTERMADIDVHMYGAHIFHTSDSAAWEFALRFAHFNNYINTPVANYNGTILNLPFNMNTYCRLWHDVQTPAQAMARIDEQRAPYASITHPANLKEQALKLVGDDLYYTLVEGYSEKQWGRKATDIPPHYIKRLPLRFTFDNNYFTDVHQGIPTEGYTHMMQRMTEGIEVRLNTDYLANRAELTALAARTVYTGAIDALMDYRYGTLDYRSLRFEHRLMRGVSNYQGNAVVNHTAAQPAYTRTIEHKHFVFGTQPDTVVSTEYPTTYDGTNEPFYPIEDERNRTLANRYQEEARQQPDLWIGGRLAEYRYFDMDDTLIEVLCHPWLQP